MDDLIFYVVALLVAGYIFSVWLADLKAYRQYAGPGGKPAGVGLESDTSPASGTAIPRPVFAGATPVGWITVVVAIGGAIVLLAGETAGEFALGIAEAQTKMTVLFGLYTLAAAFIEELIFRGYLYYDRGTRGQFVLSIIGVSFVFAVLHPYMWHWNMPEGVPGWQVWQGRLSPDLSAKGLFSTAIVFIRSLWFYCVLFWPANKLRSLIPPVAAHFATNLGVLAIKAAQGNVEGWY